VARGKLSLLKAELSGEADLERRMADLLSHCLLCGACAEFCTTGVKGDELILAGREMANRGSGPAWLRSLLTRDLFGRGPAARGLWKSRELFLRKVPPDSGLHFRFPLSRILGDRHLPPLAERSFLEELRDRKPLAGQGPRVGLFVGCVSNYMRPETARAAVRLLESAGATVVVPENQVCCGKPAAGAGDAKTAAMLARKNLTAFNPDDFDYIATFCATCSEQLKHYAKLDVEGGEALAAKVTDLSVLLAGELGWRPNIVDPAGETVRVFYHDPCHLRRKQGVVHPPRKLIESVPGVELVGADEPPVCCGYGGVFNLWHYDLSRDVFAKRAESMGKYAPDLAVTACSGCWLQFVDCLYRLGDPVRVVPLAELLAERGLEEDK
jgi:glycolate oxidase iron-sulfur subunit